MNDKDLPGKSWRLRQCKCGCDSFRLIPSEEEETSVLYNKRCRNCKHVLGDHITLAH